MRDHGGRSLAELLAYSYPRRVHEEYVAGIAHLEPERKQRRRGESLDFWGVEDEDLVDHYEQVMGLPFEWRETNPVPESISLKKIHSMFTMSFADRRKRNTGSKDGSVYDEAHKTKVAINAWTDGQQGGVSPEEAVAAGKRWLCPSCGYVPEGLHGEDELMHCPELDCDQVLTAALPRWVSYDVINQQAQRRVTVYQAIDCGECGKSFQREGRSQGRRQDCYDCKPKGGVPATPRRRPAKTTNPPAPPVAVEPEEDPKKICAVPLSKLKAEAEAEALVKVADALEGLDKNQVSRVLGWAKQAVL